MDILILIVVIVFFVGGFIGLLYRQKNLLSMIICLELLLLGGISLIIFIFDLFLYSESLLFILLLLVISTVETAVGLSLFILIFRKTKKFFLYEMQRFKF